MKGGKLDETESAQSLSAEVVRNQRQSPLDPRSFLLRPQDLPHLAELDDFHLVSEVAVAEEAAGAAVLREVAILSRIF